MKRLMSIEAIGDDAMRVAAWLSTHPETHGQKIVASELVVAEVLKTRVNAIYVLLEDAARGCADAVWVDALVVATAGPADWATVKINKAIREGELKIDPRSFVPLTRSAIGFYRAGHS